VYHLEIEKFPHVFTRFNMSERDLAAIVVPWVRREKMELGEHTWNPNEASLTVIEGPELPIGSQAVGRGWPIVVREGENVTERVLAAAAAPRPEAAAPGELAGLLGADGASLLEQWRAVAARSPELAPSEALALAEHALRTRS